MTGREIKEKASAEVRERQAQIDEVFGPPAEFPARTFVAVVGTVGLAVMAVALYLLARG